MSKRSKIMVEKNENKSIFLYTALIFLAAIVIIIISFFSQVNLEQKNNAYLESETAKSITEKTAQLSQENMVLLETTKTLNQHNAQLLEENKGLKEKLQSFEGKDTKTQELFKAFKFIKKKDIQSAKKVMEALAPTDFSGDALSFYEYLAEEIK